MFALWYLTFAIDEMRKRYGWTFLDIFYPKTKTVPPNNVLDNKPTVVAPKVPEPAAKPATTTVTVTLKPTNKPTPTTPASVTSPTPQKPSSLPTQQPTATKPEIPAPLAKPSPELPTPVTPVSAPVLPVASTIPANTPATPLAPFAPKKSNPFLENGDASLKDALDKKLMQASDTVETVKNDLKNATANFLSGESSAPSPTKNIKPSKSRKDTMVDAAVLTKLEEGFAKLAASDSKSLLKKYLTKEIFDNLKEKKTPTFGSSLLDCIQSGLENHDSGVGIYAPDAEAYTVFADLFDPIIEDYHGGFKKTDKHPPREFGDVNCFSNLDPNNEFIISTRVRCGRSLQGYPFNPCLTEAQYKEMEEKVSSTLSGLEGELKGKFYPLTGMEKAVQQQLIDDHFLFKEGDRFLQAANACRFWPTGRGIYHNDNKTFLVWCNEEDHLRIISMQMGGDLGEVYRRLVCAVNEIEKRLPFSHDDRLGFLTFCPTNLGTTIRASVHIKVPKLAANKAKLEEVAAKYNLQVRGTRGEHTEAEGGVYDISNKRRMGLTEFDAVKEMNDGIAELIKLEKGM
ncbi:arginine kinase isoform X1 [Glossina fuscipes]|uniref:arginine kinase n=2 Tax=Glossina fuscipes TaxID=7396 RepID=A0A8U0W2X1_9MUSC|nr:arginine kinase isoform X1 [Glossina fuscipes]XP_037879521.1 arginine kinase isoform X1 [Glossina fuscipes]